MDFFWSGLCVRRLPAVDEVGHRVVLAEAGGVQISTDLHIITRQQLHSRHALLLEHTALQRRAQQQQEVICREREKKKRSAHDESLGALTQVQYYSQRRNRELGLVWKSGKKSHLMTSESMPEDGRLHG